MRPPLVLTGPPGAGKTSSGRRLAAARQRCAFVDADDVRQLVVGGAAAPWDGEEGDRQRLLGARNAAVLAASFRDAGFECVVADVLTPAGAAVWRELLPEALIVRLVLGSDDALQRLGGRHRFITEEERRWTHEREAADPPEADAVLAVASFDAEAQVAALDRLWSTAS